MNDSTTIFIDFHKKHPKTLCFSVVSRPAEAQVPIFTAQMKKASKKCQKSIVFFDFSNHAGAQVPIFTPKMKNSRFARLARLARLSTRKWDFRRRSRPRELAQRSQDDVSLNKLPQMTILVWAGRWGADCGLLDRVYLFGGHDEFLQVSMLWVWQPHVVHV